MKGRSVLSAFVALSLAGAASTAFPAETAAPATFRIAFDGNLDADGGEHPARSANVRLVPGVRGQAAYLPADAWLEYAFATNSLSDRRGSFSVWAKTDWTYNGCCGYRDRDLDDNGEWGALNASRLKRALLKVGDWRGVRASFGTSFNMVYVEAWGGAATRGFCKGGEWHHYAGSYDAARKRYRLYVDGRLMHEKEFALKAEGIFPKTFTLGCGDSLPGNGGPRAALEGAVDEFSLYDREVSPEEVMDAFTSVIPYRIELMDYAVTAGVEKNLRFRVRNISREGFERMFDVAGKSVRVAAKPGELAEFSVPYRVEAEGLHRIEVNAGKVDFRWFEIIALAPEVSAPQPSEPRRTCLGTYDCTRDYPSNVFNHCGSHVVTNACGIYRECETLNPGTGLAYRFRIRNKGLPHVVELVYPDDAKREFSFAAHPENYNRLHTGSLDCAGIITGVDHPNTFRMQRKRFVFWPDSDTVSVCIYAYKPIDGSKPPAAASVSVYELDVLPPSKAGGASRGRRSVGVWDEDPTMDAQLVFNHALNYEKANLEFWRVKWQRTIDYMRYQGIDAWDIKVLSYRGDMTGMDATFSGCSPFMGCDGRCFGWADAGADMLDKAGMDIWVRLNHKFTPDGWIARLGGDEHADIFFRDDKGEIPGHYTKGNFLHPVVMNAYKEMIRAYRDKFRVYGHFRGITLNEAPACDFYDIFTGYDDLTVGLFEKETGIRCPKSCQDRYRFLVGDQARRKAWIDWRCRKVTEAARELVAVLREKGDDLVLQWWVSPYCFLRGEKDWFGWDPDASARKGGIDLKALSSVEGLCVMPIVRPDFFRAHGRYDTNEEHFQFDERYRRYFREAGVRAINLERHSNLEIYPSMTARKNFWKRPFWMPTGSNVAGVPDFYDYPTPHPNSEFCLESLVGLVADYDLQDIMHGFWGLPEQGEHGRFRTFYTQFRKVPRGEFRLLDGVAGDPVAVRVGRSGYYLVNRTPCVVEAKWKEDGKARDALLDNCEIRYFPTQGEARISDFTASVGKDDMAALAKRLAVLDEAAKEDPANRELADIAGRARRAFGEGRYSEASSFFKTAAARAAVLKAQGLKVLSQNALFEVWAQKAGEQNRFLPCSFFGALWDGWGLDSKTLAENRTRLKGKPMNMVYSVGYDPERRGLLFTGWMSNVKTPEKVLLEFDPKNDDAFDETGFSHDNVRYELSDWLTRENGQQYVEKFIPFSDLKGWDARPGSTIGMGVLAYATCADTNGEFRAACGIGFGRMVRGRLHLSARKPGSKVIMSVDSGKHKAECRVETKPQELTLAFTPDASGTVNFDIRPDWAGVGRVAELSIKGARWAGRPPAIPSDVVYGGRIVTGNLAVTAGVPVEMRAVITVREEWQ